MIRRALASTGGSFDLRVTSSVETSTSVAASMAWSAVTAKLRTKGLEWVVYEVGDDRVVAAWFHPGDNADDESLPGEVERP